MRVSRKQKTFPDFLLHFWNLVYILNILEKKEGSHTRGILEITDLEKHGYINV